MIVHQHHHYGWTKDEEDSKSLDEAVRLNVLRYHDFLTDYQESDYEISHDIGAEFPRYRVIWSADNPKPLALGSCVNSGQVWFGDRIEIGEPDDCDKCGGTGVNHYNPFVQCWKCGDGKTEGKGSGKISL